MDFENNTVKKLQLHQEKYKRLCKKLLPFILSESEVNLERARFFLLSLLKNKITTDEGYKEYSQGSYINVLSESDNSMMLAKLLASITLSY